MSISILSVIYLLNVLLATIMAFRVLSQFVLVSQQLQAAASASSSSSSSSSSIQHQHQQHQQHQLDFTSPAPHYFSSTQSLLKQWPAIWFPAGHTIAVVEIPVFTRLFHGRKDNEVPGGLEWLAFDIAESYGLNGGTQTSYMLTYMTARPIRLIYFDGLSATVAGGAALDTQFLTFFGNITGPNPDVPGSPGGLNLESEIVRMRMFCAWLKDEGLRGGGWGFEGILRLAANFEVVWCDFRSESLRLESHLDVSVPLLGALSPVERKKGEPFTKAKKWSWYKSAAQHYDGEKRVRLHQCAILNYYSPEVESQDAARRVSEMEMFNLTSEGHLQEDLGTEETRREELRRLMLRRRFHRLSGVSTTDANQMREKTRQMLHGVQNGSLSCSGVDWTTIGSNIFATYVSPLKILEKSLSIGNGLRNLDYGRARNWSSGIRDTTHELLLPFLEYPTDPTIPEIWSNGTKIYELAFDRCRNYYTSFLNEISLNEHERLLKWSVEEVLASICTTILTIGFAVEELWATEFNTLLPSAYLSEWYFSETRMSRITSWHYSIQNLMAWLGWADQWNRCEEVCGWDEICSVPVVVASGGIWDAHHEADVGRPRCAGREDVDEIFF